MSKKLFSANPARIGGFDGSPTSDAIPASLVDGTPSDLKADLIALLADEVEIPNWHNPLRDCRRPRAIASRAGRFSEAKGYVSANRTCEMGFRHATGRPYESFLYVIEELSRPEAN